MPDLRYVVRKAHGLVARFRYCVVGDARFGQGTQIGRHVVIEREFKCGDLVYIGPSSYVGPRVTMGNFCMVSDHVHIIGCDHIFNRAGTPVILAGRPEHQPPTVLEDDVWVGHASTIMRGVTIGEGAIIGANSVVTRDLPPYGVYVGSPARLLRQRFTSADEVKRHQEFLVKFKAGKVQLTHDRRMP